MNLSSTPRAGKRKAYRQGRRGFLVRSGQVLAITETAAGWQAVVANSTAASESDPITAVLAPIEKLSRREQLKATEWIEHVRQAEAIPDDLAKVRDRYLARSARATGGRARDVRMILELLQRLAKAESAPSADDLPPAANEQGDN